MEWVISFQLYGWDMIHATGSRGDPSAAPSSAWFRCILDGELNLLILQGFCVVYDFIFIIPFLVVTASWILNQLFPVKLCCYRAFLILLFITHFRYLNLIFATLQSAYEVRSVRSYASNNWRTAGEIFIKLKIIEPLFEFPFRSDKFNDHFTWIPTRVCESQ
jgi:hypothetical protein